MSISGSIQERTILLNVNDNLVELTASKIPVFTTTTISIIKKLKEHKVSFNNQLDSSRDLGTSVSKLATKIEELKDAKDHKTRNIILAVLKGALYVGVLAATIFAGVAGFTFATSSIALGLAFPGGLGVALGLAAWNVNDIMPITHWGEFFIAIPIAPFTPLFSVFANISKLEKEVQTDTKKINLLLTSLSDFYTNEQNMEHLKEILKKQIAELENSIDGMQSVPEMIKTIQIEKAKKETAFDQLEAAIEFFKNLTKTQEGYNERALLL